MQRQDNRYLAGFLAHEDLADYAKPYFDFTFMDDKTHQAVAPAAAFTTSNPNTGGPYAVNCGNPYLSAQQQGILGCTPAQISGDQSLAANQVLLTIGRRNVEGGARTFDYEHTNYRAVLGMKGDFLDDAWNYDAYGQYYYVTFNEQSNNYFSYAAIDNALLATNSPTGPVCLSGKPCVPWNIFSDGGVTQQQLNYLYLLGTAAGNNTCAPSMPTSRATSVNTASSYRRRMMASGSTSGTNTATRTCITSLTMPRTVASCREPAVRRSPSITPSRWAKNSSSCGRPWRRICLSSKNSCLVPDSATRITTSVVLSTPTNLNFSGPPSRTSAPAPPGTGRSARRVSANYTTR